MRLLSKPAGKRKRRTEGGQSVVIVAAAMVILLVFAAFAVDLSFAYFQRRSMQNAADAAALAGARALGAYHSDPTAATMTAGELYLIIQEYATRNTAQTVQAFYTSPGKIRLSEIVDGSSDAVPASGVAGVEVIAGTDFSTFFAKVLGYTMLAAEAQASASYGAASTALYVSPLSVRENYVQIGQTETLWNRNDHSDSVETGWLALGCQYPSFGSHCSPNSTQITDWLDEGYAGFVRTETQVSGVSGDEFWSHVSVVSPGDVLILPAFDEVFQYTTNPVCEPIYISENGDEECLDAQPLAGVTPVYTTNSALESTYYYHIIAFAAFEVHSIGHNSLSGRWISYSVVGDWVNPHNKGVYVAKLTDVPQASLPESTPTPEPSNAQWVGETAWAANGDTPLEIRYTQRGNWATYVSYTPKTTTLFAGRTNPAGTATFSAVHYGLVTITISLNNPWEFADVAENLKVHDYGSAPSGNPAPGLFAHKKTCSPTDQLCVILAPANNFYGVHLDVGHWVP